MRRRRINLSFRPHHACFSLVDAAIDHWAKDIAPSTELRKWFGHDPARWQEFRRHYAAEVHQHPEQLGMLRALAGQGPTTLVYSAHDEAHNDAVALKDFLLGHIRERDAGPDARVRSPKHRSKRRI